MTTTYDQAAEAARHAATGGPVDRALERIGELVGSKANVRVVFGEPISKGDLTVIPVARVRWGFGGGSGSSEATPEGPAWGSGGGGGAVADPGRLPGDRRRRGDIPADHSAVSQPRVHPRCRVGGRHPHPGDRASRWPLGDGR